MGLGMRSRLHANVFAYYSNGRQTVGDGAFSTDMTPSVIAVCHMEGTNSMYYYSTTFSGGPGVSFLLLLLLLFVFLT